MLKKYNDRFEELENELLHIENTKHKSQGSIIRDAEFVNQEFLDEWRVKAKNLIANACGNKSEHYKEFEKAEQSKNLDTNYKLFLRIKAVFHAAKDDYYGGYLNPMKNLVQAELFDIELDQAEGAEFTERTERPMAVFLRPLPVALGAGLRDGGGMGDDGPGWRGWGPGVFTPF